MARKGKIARLPHAVREELNHRLRDGEEGPGLVAWLNALPEVQAMLARQFGSRPINAQNLTEWRQGGFRDWLAGQEAADVVERLEKAGTAERKVEGKPLIDTLAYWVSVRYALATDRVASTEGDEGWRLLRQMCRDILQLRRSDHCAQKLKLEHDRKAQEERGSKKQNENL